jgi:hypothetical protein
MGGTPVAARCESAGLGASLVRPFGIALTNEIVEAGLLLQAVHSGPPGGLDHPHKAGVGYLSRLD